MEIFNLKNVSFKYPGSREYALNGINLEVCRGDFLLLMGESGSGKTTLLRLLKKELWVGGDLEGLIFVYGNKIQDISSHTSSSIGFIMQNPDSQIVCDKVYSELAFGLESLGCTQRAMRARVSEFATYFGISHLFNRSTNSLSQGQKQLINLASVMAMNPRVLILDEPISRLDPIAGEEFINSLRRLNYDLGTTIIMAQHSVDNAFTAANRVAVLEKGRLIACGAPKEVCPLIKGHNISRALPSATRIYNKLDVDDVCPLNVKEGREFLNRHFSHCRGEVKLDIAPRNSPYLTAKDLWFRYTKAGDDVLKGCDICVNQGEIYALMGANGSGKSTLLSILSGGIKPYRGKVKGYKNKISALPQNPLNLFVKDRVRDDLEMIDNSYLELCDEFNITHLLNRHPCDLSGGEIQKAAVCKVMLTKPDVLLLDEPTKGMDAFAKDSFGAFLKKIAHKGTAVLLVTHDLEFCAMYAHRCGLLFDGVITTENYANPFFASNSFYTTKASRISRDIFSNAVTVEDVVRLCKGGCNEKENC